MRKITTKSIIMICSCLVLASCGGEKRVDGEMAFDPGSLMTMAESFLKAGDYSSAMRLYQRAANESPKHVPSRLGLARTYQALGATDAALNFYDQVLKLDPDNREAKLGSGQMLITKNRPRDAIPYLTELTKRDPDNYKVYNMLGLAHDLLGEQEEAQMNYGQGLELAPDNISLLNNLALSFAFEGQYAPAIKLLSKAINLDYTVTKAQQNLVLVYVLSGEEAAGRQIGAALMTESEMANNIRHYNWVKTLTSGQRAQAIYLGMKSFPQESEKLTQPGSPAATSAPTKSYKPVPSDPKKAQLQALLEQEEASQVSNSAETQSNAVAQPQQSLVRGNEGVPSDYVPAREIYRVQLAAYPNTAIAEAGWQKIKRRSGGLLDTYDPLVKLVTLANGKTLFRLFVGGIEVEAVARETCEALQDRSVDCLVLKTLED